MKLVIVGAGRHGRELESYLLDFPERIELVGFIDEHKPPGRLGRSRILGGFDVARELQASDRLHFITASGDNRARQRMAADALEAGLTPWSLRHPTTQVGLESELGAGSCLAPNVVLTRAVRLGRHCIANVGVTISHDCLIGDYVNLNPGVTICGDVEIGTGCYLGAGAVVIDKVSIGEWTVVGAGAVVTEPLPAHVLALGVPARVVKRLDSEIRLV